MMSKYLLGLILSMGVVTFNSAWAAYSFVGCYWEPNNELILKTSLEDVIQTGITWDQEKYDCVTDEDGYTRCNYRNIWRIANRIYSTTQSVKVTCANLGDQTEKLTYGFTSVNEHHNASQIWKNLNLSISGASGRVNINNIDSMARDKLTEWGGVNLQPCKKNCEGLDTASPSYTTNITLTFSVRPKVLKIDYQPFYDLQDAAGFLSIFYGENKEVSWTTIGNNYLSICGLAGKTTCNVSPSGGGGGSGWNKPPAKQCTLTIVTPDVVAFQPISSDDLSRNRVRTEDFTLTVVKGPDQSTPCMGSVYNLPGQIKTQGGYSISSTFWGINHSSGTPQGIGLKLYDLGAGDYLRFNYQYPSFIKDISSISESKRIRAEIATTTKDLKKIKDGAYSQVLTFEVKMP